MHENHGHGSQKMRSELRQRFNNFLSSAEFFDDSSVF
jgi:hypothetical protein